MEDENGAFFFWFGILHQSHVIVSLWYWCGEEFFVGSTNRACTCMCVCECIQVGGNLSYSFMDWCVYSVHAFMCVCSVHVCMCVCRVSVGMDPHGPPHPVFVGGSSLTMSQAALGKGYHESRWGLSPQYRRPLAESLGCPHPMLSLNLVVFSMVCCVWLWSLDSYGFC